MERCKETEWGGIHNAAPCMEDQWPEYARTLNICVDSFDAQLAVGTLCSCRFESAWDFHSLDQLLIGLDAVTQPADTVRRCFSHPSPRDGAKQTWGESPANVRSHPGKMANFQLRMVARQHSSVQGDLIWIEGKQKMAFRSGLELLLLLRDALLTGPDAAHP